MKPLKILHVFRAPVGGLFRHVLDLCREQTVRGHQVGIIADRRTGGDNAEKMLGELAGSLPLGVSRYPMRRHINPGDFFAVAHVMRRIAETQADVVHGHGAKGGAYARLALNTTGKVRAYTPHGGSLLFGHDTLAGAFYLATERILMLRGNLFLFESGYSEAIFRSKIGNPRGLVRVVHNGVTKAEFAPIVPREDATDLVFLGELRGLVKGIDVLIDSVAILHRQGRNVTCTIVGSGADREALVAQVERLGLSSAITFRPAMKGHVALTFGRIMVAPSRYESLPYVVLETAAGAKPLITTNVGGVPEIYGPMSDRLVPPGDAPALAEAIAKALDDPAGTAELARRLHDRVAAGFSAETMVDGVLAGYQAALEAGRR